jgi:hypothetical protein
MYPYLHVTQTEGSSTFGELIAGSVVMSGYLRMAMNIDIHRRPCAFPAREIIAFHPVLGDRRPKPGQLS